MNSKADKASLNNYVKKNSPEVGGDLDMKGHSIKNLKVVSKLKLIKLHYQDMFKNIHQKLGKIWI